MNNCSALLEVLEKDGFEGWEDAVHKIVGQYGCRFSEKLLKTIDDYLAKTRDKNLRLVGYKMKSIAGRYGQIKIRRRYYRDQNRRYRFLLDEALGLLPRKATTASVVSFAAILATHVPFRVAQDLLSRAFNTQLSHQSIHNLVGEIGQCELTKEEVETKELFDLGTLPCSQDKAVENLYLEADGVGIALQRENSKRAEVKVGIAYSGKEAGVTKDKVIHLGVDEGNSFWQGLTVKLAKVFNLARVGKVTIGGDGAPFVRIGQKLFLGAHFRLDPFHVSRALKSALGWSKKAYEATSSALGGNLKKTMSLLDGAKASEDQDKIKQINRVKRYLKNNADGLGEGPSLGAIESNVDKLVANRMKKRGMAWTTTGARRMLKLLEKKAQSNWADLFSLAPRVQIPQKERSQVIETLTSDPATWLSAHIAAFDGPHAGRPWVKVLREIVRGQELELTGFVPTKT